MTKAQLTASFLGAAAGAALLGAAWLSESGDSIAGIDVPETIDRICASDAPFVLADLFSAAQPDYGVRTQTHLFDADGDAEPDIQHGDLLKIKAQLTGKNVIAYGLPADTESSEEGINGLQLIEGMKHILELVETGTIPKPSALILSLSPELDMRGNPFTELGLTPDNIAGKKDEILELIRDNRNNHSYYEFNYQLYELVQEFFSKDIPVVAAAGNQFSAYGLNLLSVYGAITVGAFDYTGETTAVYSSSNSLTDTHRIGDIIARKVEDGIDLDDDGTPDIPPEMLSGGETLAEIYNGKPVSETVLPWETFTIFGTIDDALASTSELFTSRDFESERVERMAEAYGEYIDFRNGQFFRDDGNGNLIFDPDGSRDPSQVSLITGTSIAAPSICGK